MKVKIVTDKYEDVTQGKVYEVVEEWIMDYVIIDDQFDKNAIDKEHCEIVMEEDMSEQGDMFNIGDRVQIVANSHGKISLIEEWSLQGTEGMRGNIIESRGPGVAYYVQLDNDSAWYVPEELLQKLPGEDVVDDLEKPDQTSTLTEIIRFTQNNKGFSVSFEDGNITLSDWSNDPNSTFYRPKTIEELLELMELLGKINEYKCDNE